MYENKHILILIFNDIQISRDSTFTSCDKLWRSSTHGCLDSENKPIGVTKFLRAFFREYAPSRNFKLQ